VLIGIFLVVTVFFWNAVDIVCDRCRHSPQIFVSWESSANFTALDFSTGELGGAYYISGCGSIRWSMRGGFLSWFTIEDAGVIYWPRLGCAADNNGFLCIPSWCFRPGNLGFLIVGFAFGSIFILLGRRHLEWLIIFHAVYDATFAFLP
jgi:hypothetical protein